MLVALVLTTPAFASSSSELRKREHRQVRSLHRWEGALLFFRNHPRQAHSRVGRREVRRARIWVKVIRRELAETRALLKPRYVGPPVAWVEGALCVHSGWHYVATAPGERPEYVLFGRGYRRTSDVPDRIPGGSGEGGWDAHNAGYGGGMQMDSAFQRNYGREFLAKYGPAGKWSASVQLLVSYRGWLRQGWGAWPQTSRACGLR